jgi:putative nucleotidyltransferase with HDIG domain
LSRTSAERVRDEFARGLAVPRASRFAQRLAHLGLLIHVVPELEELKGVRQSYPRCFDTWRHTLAAMDTLDRVIAMVASAPAQSGLPALGGVPAGAWDDLIRVVGAFANDLRAHLSVEVCAGRNRELLVKLAALLHDIGKPMTSSTDGDGRVRFCSHEGVGARLAATRLRELRFSRSEVQRACTIIRCQQRPSRLAGQDMVTRRAVHRYFRDTDDVGVDIALLSLADYLATWGPNLREKPWMRRLRAAETLLHHYFERWEETVAPELTVDGHDLMRELNLGPGPVIGRLLDALREAAAAGEIESRGDALALAKEMAEGD